MLVSALVTIKQRPDTWVLAGSLVTAVLVHLFLWVMPLARRNRLDMKNAFFFADRAALLAEPSANVRAEEELPPRKSDSEEWIDQVTILVPN